MSRFPRRLRIVLTLLLWTGLAQSGWSAVEQPEHNGSAHSESGLTLNNGKQWPTDPALRKGMEAIQRDIREALPRIHDGSITPKQYAALANQMQTHVNELLKNCKLSPEADAQLHRIIAEVNQGAEAMAGQNGRASGAAMIVHALDLYGRHFDHAGWTPLAH
ncbi:MAG: hypothetical protein HQM00_07580 [Magnetococcales bacterium]|nr:hypothetical protein [Magnetococcales bacterium]